MLVPVFSPRLDLFLNLRCLTNSVAEIVELCSSDLTGTDNVNLLNVGRVDGECLFNSTAVRYASYGKGLGDSAAMLSDNGSLEHLDSLTGSLFDLVVYANGITNIDLGKFGLELLVCKSLK